LFREYGIRNFLEGDFFGWYLAAWNQDIEDAVSALVARLSQYDPGALELAPENARDLLKKLYHSLLPREIRHDLGEYYTPDWLAERLIRQTLGESDLGDGTKRVLDPACGSGTFLVMLIKYIRERAARNQQAPAKTLDLVLRNVVGFDLNPLAVIAARTNYLIALGDLLKERGERDIDIPVYQADSILAPSQGSDLFEGDTYALRTSVGVFRVPAAFAERERIDTLANTLDQSVEAGVSEAGFLTQLTRAARLEPEERKAAQDHLVRLHSQLTELHDQGLNGVWARIIKNAFAPVFLEPCHYVVGNPPWVNWESLPNDYRESTIPLWTHYGLFPRRERALQTILGAAKYDISMLMTYVAADKYLRPRGKLGFVLSQSLFKTAAGQGFRRFSLPDGTPVGPLAVEDMVELKPFEGASNRTAVGIFVKGFAVRYPVSYQAWRKRQTGRGSAIGFDTPYESVTRDKITFLPWQAEPIDATDPTSAWITARPRCLRVLRKVVGGSPYVKCQRSLARRLVGVGVVHDLHLAAPAQTLEGTGAADDRPRARLSQVLRHSLRHFGRYVHPHSALGAGDRPGDQCHLGIGASVGVQNGPANAERRVPKGGPLQDFASGDWLRPRRRSADHARPDNDGLARAVRGRGGVGIRRAALAIAARPEEEYAPQDQHHRSAHDPPFEFSRR
jgi:SAM-dependent methyltransferase